MLQTLSSVSEVKILAPNIFQLTIDCPAIAESVGPGQFINIKVARSYEPLLRRPFSVYHVSGRNVSIIFNVIGEGTSLLSSKKAGDELDLLGPLGCTFGVGGAYETAVLVGGGLGVAPLPLLAAQLKRQPRVVTTYLGARTANQIVPQYLENIHVATDDGSAGFHGTVVDLVRDHLVQKRYPAPKLFACGPNGMLRSLAAVAAETGTPCEVSLESAMACGIGICQGCPVEQMGGEKKYALVCKEGTIFDTTMIRF